MRIRKSRRCLVYKQQDKVQQIVDLMNECKIAEKAFPESEKVFPWCIHEGAMRNILKNELNFVL